MDIEYRQWCSSNESWSCNIPGKNGVYQVKYGKLPSSAECSHGYTCSCEAFKFGKGKECKHIITAKLGHCKWNHEAACGGGEPTPKNGKCPKCGRELTTIIIAV